ncbi:transposase family protein [Symbiopectobacterium purcellii]|uniref:transposase family protein n=1 Tax=Symbiopectobacterium purcellii TaxID=2871826 RepID=UPI003F85517E
MKFYNAYINQYLKLFNKAGIDKQHPNTQIPKKGTRKRPLSPEQKQENKIISGIRITVEHAIAGIKRLGCRVCKEFRVNGSIA